MNFYASIRVLKALLILHITLPVYAESLHQQFPKLCTDLQKEGWGIPADLLRLNPDSKAEMSIPGLIYMCNLGYPLHGEGAGRAPDLGILLSSMGKQPSLVFSGSIWCEADRKSMLEALATQVERILGRIKTTVPSEITAAIRNGTANQLTVDKLDYQTRVIDVDAEACKKVTPGKLGAVLMKMDVAIEPVPPPTK